MARLLFRLRSARCSTDIVQHAWHNCFATISGYFTLQNDPESTWAGMLQESRQRFGAAPRDFGDAEKKHLQVAFSWLTRLVSMSDPLCKPLAAQRKVFRNGVVVWGHLIQANAALFQPGRRDLPGEMLYGLKARNITVNELRDAASRVAALKGTRPDARELAEIADYLTDEFIRVFGLAVPQRLSPTPLLISTVQFARHHLPNQMLCDSVLPIVVAPTAPHYAFVLPAVYWPERLLHHWGSQRPLIGQR